MSKPLFLAGAAGIFFWSYSNRKTRQSPESCQAVQCCGIVGYIGPKDAEVVLINGLRILQNRGYDSCGISTIDANNKLVTTKFASRGSTSDCIDILAKNAPARHPNHHIGIAHTRWATHGEKTDINAHPHCDYKNRVSVIHNGTIDNYGSIKEELKAKSITFISETDTEVIANLIGFHLDQGKPLESAVQATMAALEGTWGIAILHTGSPAEIVLARNGSPLLVGCASNEVFVASESSALAQYTNEFISLTDGEICVVNSSGIEHFISKRETQPIHKETIKTSPDPYSHWTLQEISEQPESLARAVSVGVGLPPIAEKVTLENLEENKDTILPIQNLILSGCGTSLYAAMLGEQLMQYCGCFESVRAIDASELYDYNIPPKQGGLLLISQSGETLDTIKACQLADAHDIPTFSIVNVVGSHLTRLTKCGIYLNAGREVAVASTKAFTSQVVVLTLLTAWFGQQRGISAEKYQSLMQALSNVSMHASLALETRPQCKRIASKIFQARSLFVLGKGISYPVALEGALKIKEISYVHAEGFASGSLKHGPFALIDKEEQTPVIIICFSDSNAPLVCNAAEQLKARGAYIVGVVDSPDLLNSIVDELILVPKNGPLTALTAVIPLQLIAYEMAVAKFLLFICLLCIYTCWSPTIVFVISDQPKISTLSASSNSAELDAINDYVLQLKAQSKKVDTAGLEDNPPSLSSYTLPLSSPIDYIDSVGIKTPVLEIPNSVKEPNEVLSGVSHADKIVTPAISASIDNHEHDLKISDIERSEMHHNTSSEQKDSIESSSNYHNNLLNKEVVTKENLIVLSALEIDDKNIDSIDDINKMISSSSSSSTSNSENPINEQNPSDIQNVSQMVHNTPPILSYSVTDDRNNEINGVKNDSKHASDIVVEKELSIKLEKQELSLNSPEKTPSFISSLNAGTLSSSEPDNKEIHISTSLNKSNLISNGSTIHNTEQMANSNLDIPSSSPGSTVPSMIDIPDQAVTVPYSQHLNPQIKKETDTEQSQQNPIHASTDNSDLSKDSLIPQYMIALEKLRVIFFVCLEYVYLYSYTIGYITRGLYQRYIGIAIKVPWANVTISNHTHSLFQIVCLAAATLVVATAVQMIVRKIIRILLYPFRKNTENDASDIKRVAQIVKQIEHTFQKETKRSTCVQETLLRRIEKILEQQNLLASQQKSSISDTSLSTIPNIPTVPTFNSDTLDTLSSAAEVVQLLKHIEIIQWDVDDKVRGLHNMFHFLAASVTRLTGDMIRSETNSNLTDEGQNTPRSHAYELAFQIPPELDCPLDEFLDRKLSEDSPATHLRRAQFLQHQEARNRRIQSPMPFIAPATPPSEQTMRRRGPRTLLGSTESLQVRASNDISQQSSQHLLAVQPQTPQEQLLSTNLSIAQLEKPVSNHSNMHQSLNTTNMENPSQHQHVANSTLPLPVSEDSGGKTKQQTVLFHSSSQILPTHIPTIQNLNSSFQDNNSQQPPLPSNTVMPQQGDNISSRSIPQAHSTSFNADNQQQQYSPIIMPANPAQSEHITALRETHTEQHQYHTVSNSQDKEILPNFGHPEEETIVPNVHQLQHQQQQYPIPSSSSIQHSASLTACNVIGYQHHTPSTPPSQHHTRSLPIKNLQQGVILSGAATSHQQNGGTNDAMPEQSFHGATTGSQQKSTTCTSTNIQALKHEIHLQEKQQQQVPLGITSQPYPPQHQRTGSLNNINSQTNLGPVSAGTYQQQNILSSPLKSQLQQENVSSNPLQNQDSNAVLSQHSVQQQQKMQHEKQHQTSLEKQHYPHQQQQQAASQQGLPQRQPPQQGQQQPPQQGQQQPSQQGLQQPPQQGQQQPPQQGQQQQPPQQGQQQPPQQRQQQPPQQGQQQPPQQRQQQPPQQGQQQPPQHVEIASQQGQKQPLRQGQQHLPQQGQQQPPQGQQHPPQHAQQPPQHVQQPLQQGQQQSLQQGQQQSLQQGQTQPLQQGQQHPPQYVQQPPLHGQQPLPQGQQQPLQHEKQEPPQQQGQQHPPHQVQHVSQQPPHPVKALSQQQNHRGPVIDAPKLQQHHFLSNGLDEPYQPIVDSTNQSQITATIPSHTGGHHLPTTDIQGQQATSSLISGTQESNSAASSVPSPPPPRGPAVAVKKSLPDNLFDTPTPPARNGDVPNSISSMYSRGIPKHMKEPANNVFSPAFPPMPLHGDSRSMLQPFQTMPPNQSAVPSPILGPSYNQLPHFGSDKELISVPQSFEEAGGAVSFPDNTVVPATMPPYEDSSPAVMPYPPFFPTTGTFTPMTTLGITQTVESQNNMYSGTPAMSWASSSVGNRTYQSLTTRRPPPQPLKGLSDPFAV